MRELEPGEIVGLYSRLEAAIVVIAFEARVVGGLARLNPEALEIVAFAPEDIPWDGVAFRTSQWALRDWVRLRRPEPDFPRLLALPEFAPRKEAGGGAGTEPMSDGPYRLDTSSQAVTLVRNEAWDARTDPIRQALPDRVEVVTGLGEQAVVERLAGEGVRYLVDEIGPSELSNGLRHFQRMLGYRIARIRVR